MDTLRDMLRLMLVPGLGTVRLTRLLDTFGSAAGVLKADFEELARVKGISEPVLQALARKHWNDSEVERQLEVLKTIGARPVFRWQDEYPVYLAQLYDAPLQALPLSAAWPGGSIHWHMWPPWTPEELLWRSWGVEWTGSTRRRTRNWPRGLSNKAAWSANI